MRPHTDRTITPGRRAACPDQGATATEYALVAGFIAAVVVGAVTAVGLGVLDLFGRIGW